MSPRAIGWCLVAIQFGLFAALVLLPDRDDWPTPWSVAIVGWGLMAAGLGLSVLAVRHLGSALTPTPEPRAEERLRVDGLYARVRHPIYSGVLLVVVGLVVRSGSLIVLAVGAGTIAFFHAKSAWEERRLARRYPDYPAYAATVGRFVPRRRDGRSVSP